MEERHPCCRERRSEFHLSIGSVRAIISVEYPLRRKSAVHVAHGDRQDLQSQGDTCIATKMSDHCCKMTTC